MVSSSFRLRFSLTKSVRLAVPSTLLYNGFLGVETLETLETKAVRPQNEDHHHLERLSSPFSPIPYGPQTSVTGSCKVSQLFLEPGRLLDITPSPQDTDRGHRGHPSRTPRTSIEDTEDTSVADSEEM